MNDNLVIIGLLVIIALLMIAFYLLTISYLAFKNDSIKPLELLEINESLKNEIKFLSKQKTANVKEIEFLNTVNKTLREGLDAITKKNCHVKDKNTDQ